MPLRTILFALCAVALFVHPLRAQNPAIGTIRGMIRGEDGRVVQNAEVTVRSAAAVHAARSDASGRFSVPTEIGVNAVSIRLLGRQPIDTSLTVASGGTIELNAVLPRIASLDTLVTRAQPVECRDPTTLDGFNCRRVSANGFFLDQGDIIRRKPYFLGDLFFGMPGMEVYATRTGRSYRAKNQCTVTLVDGRPVVGRPPESQDLLGVEVYEKYQDVPTQYRTFSWLPPGQVPPAFPCVIVNLWTRAASKRKSP